MPFVGVLAREDDFHQRTRSISPSMPQSLHGSFPHTGDDLIIRKIIAEILSVLALSTKEMKERRITEIFRLAFPLMAEYETEKLMKRLMGKTVTALYCAALCDFTRLAKHLILVHAEDVNTKCGQRKSPLHAASCFGYISTLLVFDSITGPT